MLRLAFAFVAFALVLVYAAPKLVGRLTPTGPSAVGPPSANENGAARVLLAADRRGHFQSEIMVNGRRMDAMVDTGASIIALTYEDGRALGLVRPGERYDVKIQTANGTTGAKRVFLNSVRLGGISMRNVEAVIGQEGALGGNLLGMTFLNKLRTFEMKNGKLILEQ